MAKRKEIPWEKVRADYISGASFGVLANKYGLAKSTVFKHAEKHKWETARERTTNAIETKTIEKTAEKVANNATKLEDAKSKILDRINAALDRMPSDGGTCSKKEMKDSDGRKMSVAYDLLAAAAALEKIDKLGAADMENGVEIVWGRIE